MQALLQALALGKVVEDPLPVEGFARFVPYQHRLLTHPHHRVVLGQQAVLLPERLPASRLEAFVGCKDPLPVVWVEALGPQLLVLPLLGGVAEHLLYLGAGVEGSVRVVYRVYVGNGGYLLDEGTIPLLRLLEPSLSLPTLGDVPSHGLVLDDATLPVEDRRVAPLQPAHPTGGEGTLLDCSGRALRAQPHQLRF